MILFAVLILFRGLGKDYKFRLIECSLAQEIRKYLMRHRQFD
ncbi:hypothetical protein [Staphylococcus aureus]